MRGWQEACSPAVTPNFTTTDPKTEVTLVVVRAPAIETPVELNPPVMAEAAIALPDESGKI